MALSTKLLFNACCLEFTNLRTASHHGAATSPHAACGILVVVDVAIFLLFDDVLAHSLSGPIFNFLQHVTPQRSSNLGRGVVAHVPTDTLQV